MFTSFGVVRSLRSLRGLRGLRDLRVLRSKLFSTRTLIIVPLSLLWLPWHQFELDVWS